MRSGDKYQKEVLKRVSLHELQKLINDNEDQDEIIVPLSIDVYDVINAWQVKEPGCQQGIKKLLMPGNRHQKSKAQDLREAIDAIQRDLDYEEIKDKFWVQKGNTEND